jgi:copper resistance protein C
VIVRVVPGALPGLQRRGSRAAVLLVGSLVALVSLVVLGQAPAHAHNALRSTTPADGASVQASPDAVVLTFDQAVLGIGAGVRVAGPDGDVQNGAPQLVDETLRQPLRAAASPAGEYTVTWRVTSADGHPIDGEFTYTVSGASDGASDATSATATPTTAGGDTTQTDDEGTNPLRTFILPGIAGALVGTCWVLYTRRRKASS